MELINHETTSMSYFNTSIKVRSGNLSANIRNGHAGDILFIHGLGCSKESFDYVFQNELFKEWRLIAPDLLGFGESTKPDDFSYTMDDHANTLHKLLVELESKQPIIIAHSMGGAIGLLLNDKLPSIQYFFCLEGNLVAEDCFVSKTVASEVENEFTKITYYKNPLNFRCRHHESEPAPSPIAYYRSSVSLVKLSESGVLLDKFLNLESPRNYIYGEENKNTKSVHTLANKDIIEIKNCGHFMLNDNPHDTYREIARKLINI